MAQTGYTPIQIYASGTTGNTPAAGNLTNSSLGAEIAINYFDGKLFYKDASNNVQVIATKDAAAGIFTSITDSGNLTFTGTGNRITGDFSNATESNRVGIQSSTTNGATALSLIPNGTSTFSGLILNNSSDVANSSQLYLQANGSSYAGLLSGKTGTGAYLPIAMFTGGAERVRIDTSGNVGIETSSPASKLDITSGSARALFTNQSSTFFIGAVNTTNTAYAPLAVNGSELILKTGDAERMRIDSSGNVGIGVTSPDTGVHLRVFGTAYYTAQYGTGNKGRFGADATGTIVEAVGATPVVFYTNSTERMRIDSSGNLLVGTTSGAGSNRIYCPAAYNTTTGSAANTVVDANGLFQRSTSSRKYKTDIQDATFGLSDVLKLRPVTYKGLGENDGDTVFGGLIAEEVHDAGLTEFVQYAADGSPDALAYGNMVALAFKAIQELTAELNNVKAELAAMKGSA